MYQTRRNCSTNRKSFINTYIVKGCPFLYGCPIFLFIGGVEMKIVNKETGLIWEITDKALQTRLLAQDTYEEVKTNTKKSTTVQKKE